MSLDITFESESINSIISVVNLTSSRLLMIQAVAFYCQTTETRSAINRAVDPKTEILILSEQIVKMQA